VPLGRVLSEDPRCRFLQGDFFELAKTGFDISGNKRMFDAVLLDIDHSPKHYLNERNASFYGVEGLNHLRSQLREGGIFALWSNDVRDEEFRKHLESVFGAASAHHVEFANPYTNSTSVNSVYIAQRQPQNLNAK
jgi:spermidine synthase